MPDIPDETDEEKVARHVELFRDALGDYEREHPDWKEECVYWIVKWCLIQLKGVVDSDVASELSWANPYLELNFPVSCAWEMSGEREVFYLNSGTITPEKIKDKETATKTLTEIMVRQVEIVTLQELTNHTAFEKRGEEHTPVLGAKSADWVTTFVSAEEQDAALKSLFEPCCFGAGLYDEPAMEEGEEVPSGAMSDFNPPLISIPVQLYGHDVRVFVIFQVHPMIADRDAKSGHYPLVIGLGVMSDEEEPVTEEWLDGPWASLARWTSEEREKVWKEILEALEAASNAIRPRPAPEVIEAVVTVNASIRVRFPKDGTHAEQEITNQVLEQIKGIGQIMRFDSKFHQLSMGFPNNGSLRSSFEAVESADSPSDKGTALEKLITELFNTIPGLSIEERVRTKTEEIDLVSEHNCSEAPLSRESDIVLVECKNWSGKCGKDEFALLLQKMQNRSGRCSIAFLVSWGGFASTIPLEMLRGSRERQLIVPLDRADIHQAVESCDFATVIAKARSKALLL